MALRNAEAIWKGTLREGEGSVKGGSGIFEVPYSFKSRFEEEGGKSNPEELVGAAHAGCYAMFLSAQLTTAGFPPVQVHTKADVSLSRDDKGPVIDGITLTVNAEVPGVSEEQFQELVQKSKELCPISRALAAVPITVNATLKA